jgi:hypothetical protein
VHGGSRHRKQGKGGSAPANFDGGNVPPGAPLRTSSRGRQGGALRGAIGGEWGAEGGEGGDGGGGGRPFYAQGGRDWGGSSIGQGWVLGGGVARGEGPAPTDGRCPGR